MNNYLHSLPFHPGASQISNCNCPGQGFDPPSFKLYSEADRLPTFVLRLPPIGEEPDLSYQKECVRVMTCSGDTIGSYTVEQSGMKLLKDASSYYLIYEGGPIPDLKMNCGECYRLNVAGFYSETFWITNTPDQKIRLEFANKYQLGDVPYQAEFTQVLLIDGEICSLDAELFQNRKTEGNGKETITYQRMTKRKGLSIFQAPDFISELISSVQIHDVFKVIHNTVTYEPLKKRTEVEVTQNGCCNYDLELKLPLDDIDIKGGVCQSDTDGVLVEVEIDPELPDSCEIEDDWEPTEETVCLKFGQVPPDITPPITPVGTPPVGTTCPPNGYVVSSSTAAVDCANAWVSEGVKYKKKITKEIANGDCTNTVQITYAEPCTDGGSGTHTVSNLQCSGGIIPAPPVGTPPVGTPPVGTPPVGTPPVGTPPVGTPPVGTYPAQYEFIMGTTGYGFDATQPHGIASEWVEKIEAFNYSWGWGITAIDLWVTWDRYEETPGAYETAALQRVINFCSARGLGLSLVFIARRSEMDGFLNVGERVTLHTGEVFKDGFDVYPSYGCDRTNTLIYNAIRSMTNVLKTYNRVLSFCCAGGHAGELNNHIKHMGSPSVGLADFSSDNLSRFNSWCTSRGLATPGTPPVIVPENYFWPYPDFNDARGLEFARFTTYNIYKYYKNFCNAVKSIAPNIPCIYMYAAAAASVQFRSTANAPMNYIASPGDGMYGSDGDGLYDAKMKILVNAVNRGNFPNGLSFCEFDPNDTSTWTYDTGTAPPFGQANPQWGQVKTYMEQLYQRGIRGIKTAMAFSTGEIAAASGALQQLRQTWIGKPYNPPAVTTENTTTVEVTHKYRNGEDLAEGIDPYTRFIKYTSNDYWGGIVPGGSDPNVPVTNYLNSNLSAYLGTALVDIKKSSGTIYSYTQGIYNRNTQLETMSLTKGVTASVILSVMQDFSALTLNTTVGSLISSWNNGDRAGITLKQIIGHLSGIPDTGDVAGEATLEESVNKLAKQTEVSLDVFTDDYPLLFTPGTQFQYSTTSYQVAARMAEIVTGQTWKQLFEGRIRSKCGMGGAQFMPGNEGNPNAGYGLFCTQNEFSNFMAMIRDNGVYNGVTVLNSTSMNLILTDQTNGMGNRSFGFIRNDVVSGLANEPTLESAKGCYAWVNRSKGYSAVLFTQSPYESTIGVNIGLRDLVRFNF